MNPGRDGGPIQNYFGKSVQAGDTVMHSLPRRSCRRRHGGSDESRGYRIATMLFQFPPGVNADDLPAQFKPFPLFPHRASLHASASKVLCDDVYLEKLSKTLSNIRTALLNRRTPPEASNIRIAGSSDLPVEGTKNLTDEPPSDKVDNPSTFPPQRAEADLGSTTRFAAIEPQDSQEDRIIQNINSFLDSTSFPILQSDTATTSIQSENMYDLAEWLSSANLIDPGITTTSSGLLPQPTSNGLLFPTSQDSPLPRILTLKGSLSSESTDPSPPAADTRSTLSASACSFVPSLVHSLDPKNPLPVYVPCFDSRVFEKAVCNKIISLATALLLKNKKPMMGSAMGYELRRLYPEINKDKPKNMSIMDIIRTAKDIKVYRKNYSQQPILCLSSHTPPHNATLEIPRDSNRDNGASIDITPIRDDPLSRRLIDSVGAMNLGFAGVSQPPEFLGRNCPQDMGYAGSIGDSGFSGNSSHRPNLLVEPFRSHNGGADIMREGSPFGDPMGAIRPLDSSIRTRHVETPSDNMSSSFLALTLGPNRRGPQLLGDLSPHDTSEDMIRSSPFNVLSHTGSLPRTHTTMVSTGEFQSPRTPLRPPPPPRHEPPRARPIAALHPPPGFSVPDRNRGFIPVGSPTAAPIPTKRTAPQNIKVDDAVPSFLPPPPAYPPPRRRVIHQPRFLSTFVLLCVLSSLIPCILATSPNMELHTL